MPWDTLVRTKQLNKPELSGYIVDVLLQYLRTGAITGIAMNTGQLTGQFYPLRQNPSGYVTTGQLTGYATRLEVTGNNTAVLSYVDTYYYPRANPSGYIPSGATTNWIHKTGASWSPADATLRFYDTASNIDFLRYKPDEYLLLQGLDGDAIINFGSGVSNAYISGFNLWTTGFNGYPALSSGDINNLYVSRDYFNESHGLDLPYIFLSNPNPDFGLPSFYFTNSGFVIKGSRYQAPSELYFIDMLGRSAATFGMTYTRPLIYGLDIESTSISVTGFPVLTRDDLSGIATKDELATASGTLDDDIWRLRTEMYEYLTGTGGGVQISGAGGIVVLQSGTHYIISGSGVSSVNLADTGQYLWVSGGNQIVRGQKTFREGLTVNYYNTNSNIADLHYGFLYDTFTTFSVDWPNRQLYSDLEIVTLDWNNCRLTLPNAATLTLDWKNRKLSGAWDVQSLIISGRPVVAGSTGQFITTAQTGNFVPQSYTNVNAHSRILSDGMNTALDWGNKQLTLYGVPVLDWSKGQMTGNWSVKDLYISGYGVITSQVTGQFITTGQTGAFGGGVATNTGSLTGTFYPLYDNPSGYIDRWLDLPSDGTYGGPNGPIAGVTQGDTHEDAFDKVEVVLGKLAPPKPLVLSAATFGFTGTTYSANMQGTQTTFSSVMNNLQPTGYATGFYDADAGTLSGYINNTFTGVRTLWTGSDVGNYSGLRITNDFDYWAGTPGKAGFWSCLNAQLSPLVPVDTGRIVMRMGHSQQGMTAAITGYCDNPKTPSSAWLASGTGIGMCTFRWTDGIISLANGDSVFVRFSGMNIIGPFYNSTQVARLSSSYFSTANMTATGFPLSGSHQLLSGYVTTNNSVYASGAAISLTTYNSAGATNAYSTTTRFYVDTASNQQSQRHTAGTGRFISGGFNRNYDNTTNLSGNEELQMINGAIQNPPKVNYGNYIPSGHNYNFIQTGTYSGCRWAMFDMGPITSVSNIQLTFNNTSNFGAAAVIPDFLLYVRVSGVGASATAGWINGNANYPGVGNPTLDDAPAMVAGSSTATVKTITFGTATLTGPVYIRVGLPSGSTKSFGSVSMAIP